MKKRILNLPVYLNNRYFYHTDKKNTIIEMCEAANETLKVLKKEEELLFKNPSAQPTKSKKRQKSIVALHQSR